MDERFDPAQRAGAFERALLSAGYGAEAARRTAEDLAAFSPGWQEDLYRASESWIAGAHPLPNVREGRYTAARLVEDYGMTYPAALITIGWLRSDTESAEECLASMRVV